MDLDNCLGIADMEAVTCDRYKWSRVRLDDQVIIDAEVFNPSNNNFREELRE